MSSTAEKAIALIKQLNAENPLPVIEIKEIGRAHV